MTTSASGRCVSAPTPLESSIGTRPRIATLAVINTNYALDAQLVPSKDALAIEDKNSPYVNILVVRTGDEKRPEIQKLAKALTSPEIKKFIEEKYKGAIVPAF